MQDELKRAAEAAGKQAQDEDAADKAAAGQLSTDIEAMRVSSMYMYKTYTHTHTHIYTTRVCIPVAERFDMRACSGIKY